VPCKKSRLGRTSNAAYTNGNGTGQPNGLVPNITNIVTAIGDKIQSSSTDINSVGTDDLANLIKALDPAYRPGRKVHGQSIHVGHHAQAERLPRPSAVGS
jgi:HK97 family phage major capsid protein